MNKKIKKNGIIIFLLFILLTSVVLYEVFNEKSKKNDNIVNKLDTSVSIGVGDGYEDWSYGQWNVTTSFTNSGSNISIDESGSVATVNSNSSLLEDNTLEVTVNSRYNANTYSDDYYQLDLYYTFPLTIFPTTSSFASYYDDATNSIILEDESGNQVGFVSLGSLLYCDTYDDDCWNNLVPFIVELYDGSIYIYNGNDISGTDDYSADFTLKYALLPSVMTIDDSIDVVPNMAFLYDSFIDIAKLTTEYKSSIVNDTLTLDGISENEQVVYTSWNSKWGAEQSGYDYYIEYGVAGSLDFSQVYNLYYHLETNGELLAYSSDGTNYEATTLDVFNDFENYTNSCTLSNVNGEKTVNCSFVVGYTLGTSASFKSQFDTYIALVDSSSNVAAKYSWNKTLGQDVGVEVSYPSGTNKQFNQTLINDDAGVGALNKLRKSKNVEFKWKLEPMSSSINNTSSGIVKAFNLWNLTNEGVTNYTIELETSGGYIDSSYNSVVSPYSLNSNEYNYTSFYLLDDIEYDYILNSDSSAYILSPSEIADYNDKLVYVKINNGSYELIGTICKDTNGNIVYVAGDSRTSNNNSVSENNPVLLPDNVTDLKVTYTGNKAAVYFGVGVNALLSSSDDLIVELNDLIVSNSDIVLKNEANFILSSSVDSTKLTGTYLTSAYETNTYYGSDSVVNDTYTDTSGVKYDSITYTDYVYEQVDFFNGGTDSEASEYLTEQKDVVFYELLPIGSELDGSVKVVTYGNEIDCTTNVSSTENYDGTGRTLLKIEVTGPITNINTASTYIKSGYKISFNILYSYLSNQSYGNTLYKDMAYYSNGVLTNGYVNASEANSSSFSSTAIKSTMNKLNPSNSLKNSIYMFEDTTINKITVTVGTYVKELKNEFDTSYSNSATVIESEKYKYRLKYTFSSDYEEITNLIFVDKLESSYSDNEYFKGYLDSVDISYLTNLGVNPKVYYSTNIDVDLDNIDLSDVNSWSNVMPSDVSKIVAVAVSCGNYVFKGSDKVTPMVELNMIAPNSFRVNSNKSAYNSSSIYYNYLGDSLVKSMTSTITSIKLEKTSISLDATTSVGVGTSSNPAIVKDSFSYDVTLKNTSDYNDLEDITFELLLPDGLSINTDNITEVSDNNNGVFGLYSYDSTTKVLTYSLNKLLAEEIKNISIPVDVDFTTLSTITSFNASVQLKTLGGRDYSSDEIKLYNKLAVPELEYSKYVDTNDTTGFTDEATVIIEKGETYTYRVVVNNISTIDAKNVIVVDNIPVGLTVVESSITNGGVYNSSNNTITWNISVLSANSIKDLDYNVTVANDISLGTIYRSKAHISVVNPIDTDLMLYDDDTNVISTLYQIVSNIKVTNEVSGALADKEKEFTYSFDFSGDSSHLGNYDVVSGNGTKVGTLSLDSSGKGSFDCKLKADESVMFKLLPNGISYTIKQNIEEGYVTTNSDALINTTEAIVTGVTDEVKNISYSFNNSYSVSTSVDITAKVTYDKEIYDKMFSLKITDSQGNSVTNDCDSFGIVSFDTIDYNDVDGNYIYEVSQVNTNVNKVGYDTNTFKVVVTLLNDGKGHLSSTIKYYNKLNEEVSSIIFNNEYVPNGLIINNVNTSDYVDTSKVFKYKLSVTDSVVGTYVVKDTEGNKIDDFVVDSSGNGYYEFELNSEQRITVFDLPSGTNYNIVQDLVDYYTTTLDNVSYVVDTDNKTITHSGKVLDYTIQVDFKNNYITSGSFTPRSLITLLEKDLEDEEFMFVLKDISSNLNNGYFEYITNTLDGELNFTTIEYTRPGTYVYEISQVKGDSNHIYYDLSKCILTVTLVDNGDSTMTLESSVYEYANGMDHFENTYSVDPIVTDDEEINKGNPNTAESIGKFGLIIVMFVLVSVLFLIERNIRKKRLSM